MTWQALIPVAPHYIPNRSTISAADISEFVTVFALESTVQ